MSTLPAPFKKLHIDIKEQLEDREILTPTAFQKSSIPVIKSGVNVYCTAPIDSGKTMTLILTTLNKLKYEAVGTAPRAIVLVENKERVLELEEAFDKFTRYKELRVYAAHEQIHIDLLKSEIFEGVDVLITSSETLNRLFLANGVNITQLSIFSVDDAEFLTQKVAYNTFLFHTQSIKKCQFVFYSEKITSKLKSFENYFMEYAKTVSL